MPEPAWQHVDVGAFLPCTADSRRMAHTGGSFSDHVMTVLRAAKEAFAAVQLKWCVQPPILCEDVYEKQSGVRSRCEKQ